MSDHEHGQVATTAAEVYEQFFVPAVFAEWAPRLVRHAGVQPAQRVLDVACGTGVVARAALERVGEQGRVTGLDINPGMLAVAARSSPRVRWQEASVQDMPFADGSFDRVLCQFGLMFFDDKPAAIREMLRVLEPDGGVLAVAVWGPLAASPGYVAVAGMLADTLGAEAAHSVEAPYALGDVGRLRELFDAAGARNVRLRSHTGEVHFESVDAWLHTDVRGWTLADAIDDADYRRLQAAAPRYLQRFERNDGTVAFPAQAHIVTAGA